MKIQTVVEQAGRTATGMPIPEDAVEALGAGKRPAVRVTITGYTYRSSIAPMGGRYLIALSAENRAAAGVKGGDQVDVNLELDKEPRSVAVPDDFVAALEAAPRARETFEKLSYSNKSWHVLQVTGAKTPETRERRIAKSIEALTEGRVR